MHREVDGPLKQRLLDLLGEQPLAAHLRKRPVLDAIAGRLDDLNFDQPGVDAVRRRQRRARHMGLRQRERAAARSEPENCRGLRQWTPQC